MISETEEIIMMFDYNYLNEKAKPYGGINKIFNELSDYAEEFIIGYLEAKCGCKVSKEDVIKSILIILIKKRRKKRRMTMTLKEFNILEKI